MEIGRVCIKTMGRDAGKLCVIVDNLDGNYVMIDGETRRRKCNMHHVEPTKKTLDIKKGADSKAVAEAFKSLNVKIVESKPKKAAQRPVKQKVKKEKTSKEAEKKAKKAAKKEEKPKKATKVEEKPESDPKIAETPEKVKKQ